MTVESFILDNFNIKPEEKKKFLLLFFHSFFLGLFIAFYFVPANSVFIQHFGTEHLPLAYIAAGLVGYISTSIYSALQRIVSSFTLFLGAILFMLLITVIAGLGMNWVPEKYLAFFVFIWAWPFIQLVGIETGGIAIKMLDLRQVKRLFGLMNMGGIIASIIGYLAIPLLLTVVGHAYNLLYIGVVGILVSIFILFLIYKNFPEEKKTEKQKEQQAEKYGYLQLFKEKYFLLIFISAILSMSIIYISDFGFLASIQANKAMFSSPQSISSFMALVFGGLKIGELIISYFSSRILSRYGVKLGLTILPISLTLFILLAAVAGLFVGAASIIFITLMALNKSFERILRRGLDDPSINVLYQPLPSHQQLAVQTKVGVVMQIAIGIAGGILLIVNYVLHTEHGYNLSLFPLFFLPFLIAWILVATNLYKQYKAKIREILMEIGRQKKKDSFKNAYGIEILSKKIKKVNIQTARMSVLILTETNPKIVEPYIDVLLQMNDEFITNAILQHIEPTWNNKVAVLAGNLFFNHSASDETKVNAKQAMSHLDFSMSEAVNPSDLVNLLNQSKEGKLIVLKYLVKNKTINEDNIISRLLDDEDALIRRSAINLAFRKNSNTLYKKLIDIFQDEKYYQQIAEILMFVGKRITPELDKYFYKKTEPKILLKIVEIYAKIGTSETNQLLLKHLDYPNREIQIAVIRALHYCRFQAADSETSLIRRKLDEIVDNVLWIMVSISDIESEKNTLKLNQALELERDNYLEMLFHLLGFMYQPAIIELIKRNIIGENTIFALEIIENFISLDVKHLLIPLFDKITINQRIKKLSPYFKHKKLAFDERLKNIILRDYNKVDIWTKSKAIELLGKLHRRNVNEKISNEIEYVFEEIELWTTSKAKEVLLGIRKSDIPDEIFLCLHHADELIYSTAAKIIFDENASRCFDYLHKLSPKKHELIGVLASEDNGEDLLLSVRLKLLKRLFLFFSIPENQLIKLARLLKIRELQKNQTINFIDDNGEENLMILLKGNLVFKHKETEVSFTNKETIVRGISAPRDAKYLTATKNTQVLLFNRSHYFNLLVDEPEITQYIFERLQTL